ncbi:unnamed protein product, partial [Closterium sp. NIES-54]
THFLFSRRLAVDNTRDYSQWQSRPVPLAPPAPPAPPAPLAPHTLCLSSSSTPERSGDDEPGLSSRWGDAEDCPYDESATGAEDDVEWWAADDLPEDLRVPSFPPPNKKWPHPSKQNRDARPSVPEEQAFNAQAQLLHFPGKAKVDCKVGVRSCECAENVPRDWYLPKVPVRVEVAEG